MMSLNKTLIMSDCLVNQLIDHQKSKFLDKRDINDLFYIAGPYLINNNHWVAFIVDMIRYKIILGIRSNVGIITICRQGFAISGEIL